MPRTDGLLGRLLEPRAVRGVDEEAYGVDVATILLPDPACSFVTSEIEGRDVDLAESQLLTVRVHSGSVARQAVILEHAQQRSFTGVVKAEEHDLALLVEPSKGDEGSLDPVEMLADRITGVIEQ
ncbi:anti-anti-sigma factor, putative [Babesia ovata]|uniref:Anti-anti-sigma factor, putative n=1 Tax=Babesia ovata TaxID=189622 RepID=A0A2H6KEV6_9APIC|nr:anti-anti-sigma factor, putative [Babesia ovata]GBE61489.1 anti-anti-sigma factor, putative [Babesia ovata]